MKKIILTALMVTSIFGMNMFVSFPKVDSSGQKLSREYEIRQEKAGEIENEEEYLNDDKGGHKGGENEVRHMEVENEIEIAG